jgi:hypothetical protein
MKSSWKEEKRKGNMQGNGESDKNDRKIKEDTETDNGRFKKEKKGGRGKDNFKEGNKERKKGVTVMLSVLCDHIVRWFQRVPKSIQI